MIRRAFIKAAAASLAAMGLGRAKADQPAFSVKRHAPILADDGATSVIVVEVVGPDGFQVGDNLTHDWRGGLRLAQFGENVDAIAIESAPPFRPTKIRMIPRCEVRPLGFSRP